MDRLPEPATREGPWPAADAAYLSLARSGLGLALAGTAVTLFLTCCAVLAAVWPERFLANGGAGGERTIAIVIAVVLGLLTLLLSAGVVAALSPHGLAVDRHGIWFVTRVRAEPVSWQQISAIGGSWKEKRRVYKSSLGARIGQEIMRRLLTDRGRYLYAVDVFLHDPDSVADRHPFAVHQRHTRHEAPPAPGLPSRRLRFHVGAIGDYREMARHLHRSAPHLWIGEYRRDSPV
ncbi:hypothetical protein [Streptomonospora litoralis]|uniref:Uncharacterized protein n=1 Tax=Streptomonospora litoralis TaxID=2498135 RepID=A0A4V0ZKD8_9ACTN|nr:hypothetical protein [Streptomonospora litoralis]QBI56632.1 hypothetical protein EKD16_24440 [Streptomonospora litoralis]